MIGDLTVRCDLGYAITGHYILQYLEPLSQDSRVWQKDSRWCT